MASEGHPPVSDRKTETSGQDGDRDGVPAPAKPGARRPLLFKTAAGAIPLAAVTSRSDDPDEHGTDGDS